MVVAWLLNLLRMSPKKLVDDADLIKEMATQPASYRDGVAAQPTWYRGGVAA